TAPVLDDANGKVYVGSSNGYVAQLNASTGLVEADRHLCNNLAVSDLTLDVATPVDADLSRLMAPQDTRAARLCIPWPLATGGDIGCSTAAVATPQPRATALGPPRPNPLHGSTRLVFHLAVAGRADIAIFDLQGQRVRTLSRSWREAGEHTVFWDGRRENGALAAAGVYFCRLEIEPGGGLASEPIVVLRWRGAIGARAPHICPGRRASRRPRSEPPAVTPLTREP